MLSWTSVLLLAGPAVLLFFALRPSAQRESRSLRSVLLVYAVAAAAPLVFAILWRLEGTRVAIELHGIAFRGSGTIRREVRERQAGSGKIVIGEPEASRRRSSSFGTLVFTSGGSGKGSLRVELPPPTRRAGLISTSTHGILGATALEDGDRLCIAGSCWAYEGRSFTSGSHVVEIPGRQAEIPGLGWTFPLPFADPVSAALRTWSLDALARENGSLSAGRRVRSFLAYARPDGRLRLVALDDDVTIERAGKRVTAEAAFDVADGERLAMHSLPRDSSSFAAPGIAERRSMVHRAGRRSFSLDLDTPEVHTLSVPELRVLELEAPAPKAGAVLPLPPRKRVALSMGDAQLVDRGLYFTGLSESVAVESNALFELSRFFPRDDASAFRILTPRGPVDSHLGRVQWIGARDLAAIRVDVLRPPLFLLLVGVALLLGKVLAAHAARLSSAQILIAGALEILAGIRLLLGYRVWSLPPHRVEAGELAAVAWMALPWVFLVACIPLRRLADWREESASALPSLAGLTFSAVFCALVVQGPEKWVWVTCHLLAIGVALARTEEVEARVSSLVARMRNAVARKKPSGTPSRLDSFLDADMRPIVIAAVAFTVVRLFLLLFGWKESASLGVRVSLSVLHIPAAIVLQGIYFWRVWQRVQREGSLRRPDLTAAVAILLFVWMLPAALTSDIGLALLNVPLFVLMLLAVSRHAAVREGRWLARALVVLVVLFLAGGPIARLLLPLVNDEEFLLSAASDSNYARFLHFAAPERLQELATRRGESLAITSAVLQTYISTGLFGRGYGRSEVSPHLGDTALRDFAPAVFVAAEWGLVGTVAAILLYLLFPVAARGWLPWSGSRIAEERAGPAIAFVAAATIAVSSIYMILANHELLLLTGKNAYLLGLDSAGDVIEMIVLLLLIAYGSSVARDGDDGSFGGLA